MNEIYLFIKKSYFKGLELELIFRTNINIDFYSFYFLKKIALMSYYIKKKVKREGLFYFLVPIIPPAIIRIASSRATNGIPVSCMVTVLVAAFTVLLVLVLLLVLLLLFGVAAALKVKLCVLLFSVGS